MSEDLLNEIRKLEIRLQEFIETEQKAIQSLKNWIDKLKELHNFTNKIQENPKLLGEILELRLESIKALHNALKEMSRAEHEKSHLLESYGAILFYLEEQLSKFPKEKNS